MNYFRCTVGGSGKLTLTVTCDPDFSGKTITATDGTTTLTKTCPSVSPYEVVFNIPNGGTWTISGVISGTTWTSTVVIPNTAVLENTITTIITVYSAANDTVSFTDLDGSKTVTTDSSGKGSVSIHFKAGNSITFTSSVAKNPDDLTAVYSKAITFDENTTEVKVMPDANIMYWWGYEPTTMAKFNAYANSLPASGVTVTRNTNSLYVGTSSNNRCVLIPDTLINAEDIKKLKKRVFICSSDTANTPSAAIWTTRYGNYDINTSTYVSPYQLINVPLTLETSGNYKKWYADINYSGSTNGYPMTACTSATPYTFYAAYDE